MDSFAQLCKVKEIPRSWVLSFFEAMLADTHKQRYETYAELQHYMYGSAEVI
ncbi:MAG: squalene/phytoene synthase family protein [Candidatus Peribacteria bacterium]|nr:MAG: squalene/phytoene synthase family protein [Candidatus Peribacteria bacterium]